jgi:hypothetical protein
MLKKVLLLMVMVSLMSALSACDTQQGRSISDFEFLKKGMSYSEIVENVGEPSDNVGSGLYIFTYPLSDGRSIFISFANLDDLLDARIYDPTTESSNSLLNP